MIQSATKKEISEIFNIDSKIKYVIPKFQREYTWSKEQWESLYDDITESEGGHFIGSIICINQTDDTLGVISLSLIDGQQRLTTISLLYSAIYYRIDELNILNDDEYINEKLNLKKRLTFKFENKTHMRLEPTHQNSNFDDYQYILHENRILSERNKVSHSGLRRIYKTYNYFYKKICNFEYNELVTILKKLNSAILIKIEVNSNSDAFLLFESINNNGIPLSAIDLIKNNMLASLEKNKIKGLDESFFIWNQIIENVNEFHLQERFLRHYYNAFSYSSKIKLKSYSKATKTNLIKIYDILIKNDVDFIFSDLFEKSKIYSYFINPSLYDREKKIQSLLTDLSNIGATPSYSFLLYLFSKTSNTSLIAEVLNYLVKYFIRRNLTDYPNTRNLDQIFIDLIDISEKAKEDLNSTLIQQFLFSESNSSSDEVFIESLEGDIYLNNPGVLRFLLCKIEETHSTKENKRNMWEKDTNNRYIYTIEHIFPEGENIPQEWIEMIADGDETLAYKHLENYSHKIGNLTLTAYNSNLSNMNFARKKERIDAKNNYIGFKNGLYLNENIKNETNWKTTNIEERGKSIRQECIDLFK